MFTPVPAVSYNAKDEGRSSLLRSVKIDRRNLFVEFCSFVYLKPLRSQTGADIVLASCTENRGSTVVHGSKISNRNVSRIKMV